jgi:hypothetical protein
MSRRFHSIAALCGDGLRPELQQLFERLAIDPHSELFVRPDGMVQSGPDPAAPKRSRVPDGRREHGGDGLIQCRPSKLAALSSQGDGNGQSVILKCEPQKR